MPNKIVYIDETLGAAENAYVSDAPCAQDGIAGLGGDFFSERSQESVLSFEGNGMPTIYGKDRQVYKGDEFGFISRECADEAGRLTETYLSIYFKSEMTYSGNWIHLVFAENTSVAYTVSFYRGGKLIEAFHTDTDRTPGALYAPVRNFDYIYIRFTKTDPLSFVKLKCVLFYKKIIIEDFEILNTFQKVYPFCDDVAVGSMEATFRKSENLQLLANQKLLLYHNEELIGTYYLESYTKEADDVYSIKAVDALGKLDNETDYGAFAGSLSNVTLGNLFSGDESDVEFDYPKNQPIAPARTHLSSEISEDVYGAFYKQMVGQTGLYNRRTTLCHVCFATQQMACADAQGRIRFIRPDYFNLPSYTTKYIGADRIIGNAKVSNHSEVTGVVVYVRTLRNRGTAAGTKQSYADGIINDTVQKVVVPLNPNVSYPGAVQVSYNKTEDTDNVKYSIYPSAVVLEHDNCNTQYTIKREPYEETEDAYQKKESVPYGSKENVVEYKGYDLFVRGIDNEKVMRDFIEYLFERHKKNTRYVDAEIILNGTTLGIGDLIQIETKHDGEITGLITEMETTVGYNSMTAKVVIEQW